METVSCLGLRAGVYIALFHRVYTTAHRHMVAGFAGRRTIARGHSGKKAEDKGGRKLG